MDEIRILIGKRIKQLRIAQDLTQQQLAEQADISISFLGNIERGLKSPTIDTLYKISKALDISLSNLVNVDIQLDSYEKNKEYQLKRLLSEYAEKIEILYRK